MPSAASAPTRAARRPPDPEESPEVAGGVTRADAPVAARSVWRVSWALAVPDVAETTVSPARSPVRTRATATPVSPLFTRAGATALPAPGPETIAKVTGTWGTA